MPLRATFAVVRNRVFRRVPFDGRAVFLAGKLLTIATGDVILESARDRSCLIANIFED
jgi:hypothetical protein